MTDKTIAELIEESITAAESDQPQNKLGEGTSYTVYAFKDPALSDYAIRIKKWIVEPQRLHNRLMSSSALTPVGYGVRYNFGQPILRLSNDNVMIVPRLPGKSLKQLLSDFYAECGHIDAARTKLLEQLNEVPQESYDGLMSLANYMPLADLNCGNVILDGNKLRLTDVFQKDIVPEHGLEKIFKGLGIKNYVSPLADKVKDKFVTASHKAWQNHCTKGADPLEGKRFFSRIDDIQPINMTDTFGAAVLKERLDGLSTTLGLKR
jgi:hypothetical protein